MRTGAHVLAGNSLDEPLARAQATAYHHVYHDAYHIIMPTMLSLRLSSEQEKRLTALAARRGMTRSEWLRQAIEQQMAADGAAVDSHAIYLELTAPLASARGSGRGDAARQHSRVLKSKLHAGRHR